MFRDDVGAALIGDVGLASSHARIALKRERRQIARILGCGAAVRHKGRSVCKAERRLDPTFGYGRIQRPPVLRLS